MENENQEPLGEIVSLSSPKLNALEKLYVRTYISTLSHPKAYEAVNPGLKQYHISNPYSNRENIKFHISLALQEKAESLLITPDKIIEKLYKEATREGAGSNHAARIQALTQLGKHFGLFQEKKENDTFVFNIVSYKDEKNDISNIEKEPKEKEVDLIEYKDNPSISFTNYTSNLVYENE
ncbi:terminase small subunit [Caudoviricetes sp.]|nr:terminase small subunit [Caudoviricetes sp.]